MTVYYAPGPRITYISEEKAKRMYALHPVLHLNELGSSYIYQRRKRSRRLQRNCKVGRKYRFDRIRKRRRSSSGGWRASYDSV